MKILDSSYFRSISANRKSLTLGERLAIRNGIGPGFDHLRIGLALTILFWHCFVLVYGSALTFNKSYVHNLALIRPLISCILPMFFALSGFLVIGSALRINDLRTFVTFRTLRILPALATEITLSALVLGTALTALPLRQYVSDPRFIQYFGSLIGRVRYVLPGLFLDNPLPETVNSALWTVGPEIICYVIISLLIMTTIYRRPLWMLGFVGLYLAVCLTSDFLAPPWILDILPTKTLILAFLAGNLLFLFRDRIPFSAGGALIAFAAALGCIAPILQNNDFVALAYPAAGLLAYATVVIGLSDLPPLPFFHRGDYSYGIYIFGFPIQQTIIHFLPNHGPWWLVLLISFPVTMIFAISSWHLIEKPTLNLRRRFLTQERTMPRPPARWTAPQWGMAVALIAYGIFVADQANVFPYRVIGHRILHGQSPFVPRVDPVSVAGRPV